MKNTYSVGVFHFSLWRLLFIFIALILLGTSIYYAKLKPAPYNSKNAFLAIFDKWYSDFKNEQNLWLPNKWNAGLINSFIYVAMAFPGNKIGIVLSFIIPIIILVISLCFFFISDSKLKKISPKNKKLKRDMEVNNLNVNLDKKDIFSEDNATRETILIDDTSIVQSQEVYILDDNALSDSREVTADSICIIPDEPDFSTQEFEASMYDDQNRENITNGLIDEQNISTLNSGDLDINPASLKKIDEQQKILIDKQEESVVLKNEEVNKKENIFDQDDLGIEKKKDFKINSAINNKKQYEKPKQNFTLIKDKEDLF
ncbi:hypothetical protein ACWXVQ_01515 [Mycoplasma sp. 527]